MRNQCLILLLSLTSFSQTSGQVTKNDRKLENLKAFAKLYGYVRYFHPSDEAASVDWNKFAINGSMEILSAKNDDELLFRLKELFNPIAPSLRIYTTKKKEKFDVQSISPPDKSGYSVIAWQHFGMGTSQPKSVYKSIRLNRPVPLQKATHSFAPFHQLLDAKPFAGKQLKVKAWMKVIQNPDQGKGQLWLRVDKEKGMGFFYNMDDRPAIANEWKEYEFTANIDKDGVSIYFGAFLSGSGELLIDDYELFVKEENDWKPVPIKNGSFESVEDSLPTGWNGFGRVPTYRFMSNKTDVKKGTYSLAVSSKAIDTTAQSDMAKPFFEGYPKIGEVIKKPISNNLEVIVPLALYGTKTATFPEIDKTSLDLLKKTIEAGTKEATDGNNLSVRLANVIIVWNVFKHFFPYWNDASQDAETILKNALGKALNDSSASDFLETLQLMTAPLNDGHIWVSLTSDKSRSHTVPALIEWAENKLVVEKVLDPALETLKQGDVITAINGVTAKQVLYNYERLLSGSSQWKRSRAKNELLAGLQNTSVSLSIERNGLSSTFDVARSTPITSIYTAQYDRRRSGLLKEGIYYIDLNQLPYDSIAKNLPALQDARAIICDLRGYPNNNHQFISHLLKVKENTKWMFVPQIVYPDYEKVTYSEMGWNMQPAKEYLDAMIIFIIDGSAISYAESYMGFIKDFKLATIIGQPTAGTNGNVNPFSLPGGYRVSWTGMLVKNHDGSKHHLTGIIPDIYLERTLKGISEGRDEFLEKAIQLAENIR